jgi:hypothetical protein
MAQPTAEHFLLTVYKLTQRRPDDDPALVPIRFEDLNLELGIDGLNCGAITRLASHGLVDYSDDSVHLTPAGRDRAEQLIAMQSVPASRRFWQISNQPLPVAIIGAVVGVLLTLLLMLISSCSISDRNISTSESEQRPVREITARNYQVAEIVDGDTFKIMYDGELTKVRIANIDTPERGHSDYDKATQALQDLIEGQTVTIAFTDPKGKRDNWGRLLCTVEVVGEDVGEAMIAAGLAERWKD